MSSTEPKEDEQAAPAPAPAPENKDLVIRNGFPALLKKDGSGHWIHGEEPLPRQSFVSYTDAIHIQDPSTFLKDCEVVFTARTMEDGAAYSAGTTFFIPAVMKPRCALEGLALTIFKEHTRGLEGMFRPEQSGAEFWTLCMDAAPPVISDSNDDDGDEEDEDHAEVGIHFDADYGLEAQVPGMLLHPRLATVTYLSNVGAPTLVLNKLSPSQGSDIVKELGGDIDRGWLSGPKFGKHIAFDGRLLHGAPATFFPGSDHVAIKQGEEPTAKRQRVEPTPPQQRVTFMVNVWLNHCPMDADLLDDDIVERLKTPWEVPPKADESSNPKADDTYKAPFEWKAETPDTLDTPSTLAVYEPDPAGSEETIMCNRIVEICFNEKMKTQHYVSSKTADGCSIEISFEKGAVTLLVGDQVADEEEEDEDE